MVETILVVDADPEQIRATELVIENKLGYRSICTTNPENAVRRILSDEMPRPDLVLLDLAMAGAGGLDIIRTIRVCCPQLPIIVLTSYGEDVNAMLAVKAGANDFLARPVTLERLQLSIRHILSIQRMKDYIARMECHVAGHVRFSDIIGKSDNMRIALQQAGQAAASAVPVWISGEHGTGKELFARAIHGNGIRAGNAFVVLDCNSLKPQPDQKEADTREKIIFKLREANGGTLFLKNVTSISPEIQQQLLQLLTSKTDMDARIICADNSNYKVSGGVEPSFDGQLLQRLQGLSITLPPLRERMEDMTLLARHFIHYHAASENKMVGGITDWAVEQLNASNWPGNVRQLSHLIWRCVLLSEGEVIDAGDIRFVQQQSNIYEGNVENALRLASPLLLDMNGRIKKLKRVEEEAIRFALHYSGGCMTRAARNLGIGRSTLYRRVNDLNIDSHYISRANQTTRPIIAVSSMGRS